MIDHIKRPAGPINQGSTAKRKFIIAAIMTASLITVAGAASAVVALSQPGSSALTMSDLHRYGFDVRGRNLAEVQELIRREAALQLHP